MDTEAVPTPVRILGLEGCSSRKRRAAYRCAAFATRLHTTAVDAKRSLRIAAVDVAIAGVSGPLKAYNADARRSNPADLRYRHPLAANPSSALNLTNTKPRLRPLHLMVRETEFCGLRLAGDFGRRTRENGRNSVRRPRHASLTDRNCEGFCVPGNRVGLPAEGIRTCDPFVRGNCN